MINRDARDMALWDFMQMRALFLPRIIQNVPCGVSPSEATFFYGAVVRLRVADRRAVAKRARVARRKNRRRS